MTEKEVELESGDVQGKCGGMISFCLSWKNLEGNWLTQVHWKMAINMVCVCVSSLWHFGKVTSINWQTSGKNVAGFVFKDVS